MELAIMLFQIIKKSEAIIETNVEKENTVIEI